MYSVPYADWIQTFLLINIYTKVQCHSDEDHDKIGEMRFSMENLHKNYKTDQMILFKQLKQGKKKKEETTNEKMKRSPDERHT